MRSFLGGSRTDQSEQSVRAAQGQGPLQRGGIFFRLIFLIFILAVCALLYLARVPLLRLAGEFWVVDEPPETSDVIVVLSGDNYDAERATRAASLFKSGMAPRVVATGRALRVVRHNHGFDEARSDRARGAGNRDRAIHAQGGRHAG